MRTVTNINRYARRKERTRHELLTAAKKVLAKKGYHNSKITDIAAAADIGVGTFYLYFPTKEALFFELIEETARTLRKEIERARAQVEDRGERIRAAQHAFFRFARDNRELFTIFFGHGTTFDELLRQVYALFVADAAERFAEGVQRGAYRSFPPEIIANAMIGMSAQVVSWWVNHQQLTAEEMAETMSDFILYGIVCVELKGSPPARPVAGPG